MTPFTRTHRALSLPARPKFPTAAPIGSESAKVAAPAVTSSSGRGDAPLPVCTDRGALEGIFEHFDARFLAAGD